MTAPAKTPARRLLATYRTVVGAAAGALWWSGPPENAKDVKVEPNTGHDAAERPFAVTAAKSGGAA